MNPTLRTALDIAVRGGVFLVGQWAFAKIWDAATPGSGGADIGAGLVAFGLVILAALVWGAIDGRHRDSGRLAVTWVGTGLVTGVLTVVALGFEGGPVDLRVLLADMAGLAPFMTGLIAVPAVIAGLVSHGWGHRVPAQR